MGEETKSEDMSAETKNQRVILDETFDPALEDNAAKVANLLAKPKGDQLSVDTVLFSGKSNPEKCLANEDFSQLEYGFDSTFDGEED